MAGTGRDGGQGATARAPGARRARAPVLSVLLLALLGTGPLVLAWPGPARAQLRGSDAGASEPGPGDPTAAEPMGEPEPARRRVPGGTGLRGVGPALGAPAPGLRGSGQSGLRAGGPIDGQSGGGRITEESGASGLFSSETRPEETGADEAASPRPGAGAGALPGRATGSGGLSGSLSGSRTGTGFGSGFGTGSGLGSIAGTGTGSGSSRPPPRPGGVGASGQALTQFLRDRAAPPRRTGSATRRITQEVTQIPASAARLTPVVQNPVSGVPLPAAIPSPILGLVTPGLLLANGLRRPLPVDEAYAPLGLRLGGLTLLPAFTQSLGYDTNPNQNAGSAARGSAALRSEAELAFRGDWSAAEVAGELRGAYLEFPQNESASRPSAAGAVRVAVAATRDLRLDAEGRFLVDTQRVGSVDLQAANATSRPLIASYGATLGATQTFNRLSLSLRGLVDRSTFDDARLANGTTLSQSDRNLNQYGLRLRAGYELSPALTPFVDVLADARVYDAARDSTGLRRDSTGLALTGGAAFALTSYLTGEISGGLQHRTYPDPALPDVNAPLLSAALTWQLSPLTAVRLGAQSAVTETTLAGSSGAVTETATLEVQHDLFRNLSIVLGAAALRNAYQGTTIRETGFSATARIDYRFTRWLTLRGTYLYQQIDSTLPSVSFRDSTFLLGLRVNP